MGWRFQWVSSYGNDFNRDYRVSFTKDELAKGNIYNFDTTGFPGDEAPGLSVFHKDAAGNIFHTYSTYGRGLDELLGPYIFLDRVPKGRDEAAMTPHAMAWVRHHDRYSPNYFVEPAESAEKLRRLLRRALVTVHRHCEAPSGDRKPPVNCGADRRWPLASTSAPRPQDGDQFSVERIPL
jgi:hypothetical protein